MDSVGGDGRLSTAGFPHSEISGSMPACGSPKLIAACHALLQYLAPRHPPCALHNLLLRTLDLCFSVIYNSRYIIQNNLDLIYQDSLFKEHKIYLAVEHTGLEPVTSGLQSPRSPS